MTAPDEEAHVERVERLAARPAECPVCYDVLISIGGLSIGATVVCPECKKTFVIRSIYPPELARMHNRQGTVLDD